MTCKFNGKYQTCCGLYFAALTPFGKPEYKFFNDSQEEVNRRFKNFFIVDENIVCDWYVLTVSCEIVKVRKIK